MIDDVLVVQKCLPPSTDLNTVTKYLGDNIHQNGTLKLNHAMSLSREWGNNLLSIIKEAPLGCCKIKSGLILRKFVLINTILCSSEAWHGITEAQVGAFDKFMRF